MKILLTGDVHIGRRSTRLQDRVDSHRHSCSAAWARIVELAISEAVDLVVITGDLVDQANRYLEAIGPLERGIGRLASAGIRAVAVAGNHDHDVLPALVDSLATDRFRLLGRRGDWERLTVEAGGARIHLDGWSFTRAHHPDSPLRGYEPTRDGAPILALLHADLDQPTSRYAPIATPELRRFPDVTFLLGHVHARRVVRESGGATAIYPGSPQAMDPGEPGEHGVTLLRLESGGFTVESVPLSTVRYETLDVSVLGLDRPEDIDRRLADVVREHVAAMGPAIDRLESVRYRLRLIGASSIGRLLESRLDQLSQEFEFPAGSGSATVESFSVETTPAYDLDALSRGLGAPALVARLLRDGDADPVLRAELDRVAETVYTSRSFMEVAGHDEDLAALREAARAELKRATANLLDELFLQKSEGP